MPSVCTMRRASISERISATRRPSLVVSIHMATAVCVELIAEVRIGLRVCWLGHQDCGGWGFSVTCYAHGSSPSKRDSSLGRTTTARIGDHLVSAGDAVLRSPLYVHGVA